MIKDQIFFTDKIDSVSVCDSTFFYFTGSSFSKPTDFKRVHNEEHNLQICENCNKNHKIVTKRLEKRFQNFPFCCDKHRNLAKNSWFNKSDFTNVPKLTADKIYFTWDFVRKYIDGPNWEIEITDYISHVIETHGSFPNECGEPLFLGSFIKGIREYILDIKDKKYKEKKQTLIDFLDSYYIENKKNKNTDLNVLLGIYDKWFKTFPFDISIFKNLKEHFSKTIPVFETTHYNKYSETTIAIPTTKKALIKRLCNVTNRIVSRINSLTLYEAGRLNDVENYKLEIILQKRSSKIKQGYNNDTKEPNSRYRKILKEWYKDELEFISELQSTLNTIETKKNNLFLDILYSCGKMQENKIFWDADENTRTKQILDLLEIQYSTKDQTQIGKSTTGKKPGSVDGIIIDGKRGEHIIEALNLSYLNKNYIQEHIKKLEVNYDSKGLKTKFLISYCEISDHTFEDFFKKYKTFIDTEAIFKFSKECAEVLEPQYSNQRIFRTIHNYENTNTILYHILLKIPIENNK